MPNIVRIIVERLSNDEKPKVDMVIGQALETAKSIITAAFYFFMMHTAQTLSHIHSNSSFDFIRSSYHRFVILACRPTILSFFIISSKLPPRLDVHRVW
jgi:hypothetical protein